jgi:hypothetical protein
MRNFKKVTLPAFLGAVAAWALLFLSTCTVPGTDKDSPTDAMGNVVEGHMAFWVKLKLDDEIIAKYKYTRVIIINDDGAKIGTSSGPFDDGNGNARFKITVPEDYEGTAQRFVVEFMRDPSPLDDLAILQAVPIAVGILKAFYYEIPNDTLTIKPIVPAPGGELLLPPAPDAIGTADLKMGYSPKSIDILRNIPNLPNLYKINLDLTDAGITPYISQWYRTQFGVITRISEDGTPEGFDIDPTSSTLFNPNNVAGICGGDDWYMVLNDMSLKKGDMVRVWVIFTNSVGNPMPRLYYADIMLPDPFDTITLTPSFAAIPIINESYFRLMLIAGGIHTGINFDLPTPFDALTPAESYVLTQRTYNFSMNPTLPVSFPSSINLPPLHPWNPYPEVAIYPLPAAATSEIFSNFQGRFDGGNYAITGLEYALGTSLNKDYGFFAKTSGAEICNMNLEIESASGELANGKYLGGLVGKAASNTGGAHTTIDNVTVRSPVYHILDRKAEGGRPYTGGIAGWTDYPAGITRSTQNVATDTFNQ